MPRLIDADKLRKDVLDLPNCYNGFSDAYDKALIIDLVDEQPTVNVCPYWDNESDYCALSKPSDAVPVRHGHWIKSEDADDGYCSVCKCDMPMYREDWEWEYSETPYCPNCGAKMDEERREDAKTN